MERILFFIKKYIPRRLFRTVQPFYHFVINFCAALWYGFPSRRIIVVGVTGTTGKTTTVFFLAHILRHAGMRVGYTSTALLSDGKRDWLNDKKMTMLGRFFTQKMLARMRRNACDVAIIETTSEGIVQYRHRFINYDILLFTGLYPEHIESHGSFDAYKAAKVRLFKHLARCAKKRAVSVKKTIIANCDDEHVCAFLAPWAERKIVFSQKKCEKECARGAERLRYAYKETNDTGVKMHFNGSEVQTRLLGSFSATNSAAAASVAYALGVTHDDIIRGIENLPDVPGRMERINAPEGYMVIVDYAFEPVAMRRLYETVAHLKPQRIIHVLGGTGGGRDRARRPKIGAIAGKNAHSVIVTNEDPYDEDPQRIMEDVARGVRAAGKSEGNGLVIVPDRRDAIRMALVHAQAGDIVLITGKGSEQAICVAEGRMVPHDDRAVVREILGV